MTLHQPQARTSARLLACSLACSLAFASAATTIKAQSPSADAAPKKQLPADQRAFTAARSTVDPEKRLAAMRSFVHDYPESKARIDRAQTFILTVLLDSFPEREAEVDAQAKIIIKSAGKGESLSRREVYIAFLMAEAGKSGVDLRYAEKIAKDAVNHLTEPAYAKANAKMMAKYKMPPQKPSVLHKDFANTRADALAILADVYLRQGKQAQAAALITEAYGLDPLVDDVNSQRGRLALLDHNDALALESFERAQLLGALSKADRETMMQLYRQAHSGSDTGFVSEMDAIYAQLYPASFTPSKPKLVTNGHTVLLELFTGSACGPCVGGDLAVDGILEAYPRSEIVALAFDQHIPEPDPLANADSVARADVYDVNGTPSFILDGETQPFYGAIRENSKDLYDKLTKAVDTDIAVPSSIQLKVTASKTSGGQVVAQAIVTVPGMEEVTKALAPKPKIAAAPTDNKKAAAVVPAAVAAPAPVAAPPAVPHLVVNFALVEDEVRYSGENGIRFHRMVVRALAKPANSGFPVEPASTATLDASFDPASISTALTAYLDEFEQKNDRFGKIQFISKDTSIQPSHLAIAAWVQDTVTHRVVQAAFVPLGEPETRPVAQSTLRQQTPSQTEAR